MKNLEIADSQGWLNSDKKAVNRFWWYWNDRRNGHAFWPLIGLPLGFILIFYLSYNHGSLSLAPKTIKSLAVLLMYWLSLTYLARLLIISHAKHCLSLKFTDAGLTLKNKFTTTFINWNKIKYVLPTRYDQFLVSTTDGDFYFPSDQVWSQDATQRIKNTAALSTQAHQIVMHPDPRQKIVSIMAVVPLLFAFVFCILRPFINNTPYTFGYIGASLLFILPVAIIFGALAYPVLKAPKIFLVNDKTLTIVDQNGEHHISLSDVKSVRFFFAVCMITTRNARWFVPTRDVTNQSLLPAVVPKKQSESEKRKIEAAHLKEVKQLLLKLDTRRNQT